MAKIKGQTSHPIRAGDVLVVIGRGSLGADMEEIYQVTSALRHLTWGKHVAVLTDAPFSGVSTGASIGHISPEALAGGPIGKVRDGDMIQIVIDRHRLEGRLDLIGEQGVIGSVELGNRILAERTLRDDLAPDPDLPEDTKLWAWMQHLSGGVWQGCVYDVERITYKLRLA